ncbi:hypothetical protein LG3211_0253 [Lysobacter gummosus]|nr:hypothetical protein LG3211_0253 [Lysobacter gummosus]
MGGARPQEVATGVATPIGGKVRLGAAMRGLDGGNADFHRPDT